MKKEAFNELNEIQVEIESLSTKMIARSREVEGDIITIRSDPIITDLWHSLCRYHKKAMLLCTGLSENKPEMCKVLEIPQACINVLHLSEEEICCEVFKRRLKSKEEEKNKVKYLMSSPVITVIPKGNVAETIDLMRKHGIGSLVVMEKGKIMGIITEHDIMSKLYSLFKDPRNTLTESIMTKSPIFTIMPDADIKDAIQIMSEHNIMHLPVIENGKAVGMLAIPDFYQK